MKTLIILSCLISINIFSQSSLFIPLNIKQAYEKGTRSYDGLPGADYWQNSANYNIKVSVDPFTGKVSGSEEITYFNNSTDTLKEIYIKLSQNLNKANSIRDFSLPMEAMTDGMSVMDINIDGELYNETDNKVISISNTVMKVTLKKPIPPSTSTRVSLEWNFRIPEVGTVRMGKYDSTSYFIAYWYPQISVYDDIDGWDNIPYTGYQETYNDFNNYKVEINVPPGFSVWGTGKCKNLKEIYTDEIFQRYEKSLSSEELINIITEDDLDKEIFKTNSPNTFLFGADGVTDFAFGLSDHYLWDATSYKTEDGRRVYVAAAYKKESMDFYDVAQIAQKSIKFFSTEMPGVPFPFPSLTVFNGSGGMEFPMMINDGSASTFSGTVGVTSHEIAHQYMPFYLGTNEKKYAWMDEGWAVFLPMEFQEEYSGGNRRERSLKAYLSIAATDREVPLLVTSDHITGRTYRIHSYNRPATAYFILEDILGKEKFGKALKEFIHRWNGKHPTPYDFYFTFEQVTGEDLTWFWEPWFFEFGYPDLGLKDVNIGDENIEIIVIKEGDFPVPLQLTILGEQGEKKEVYHSAAIWKDGKTEFKIETVTDFSVKEVRLGRNDIPDLYEENNLFVVH